MTEKQERYFMARMKEHEKRLKALEESFKASGGSCGCVVEPTHRTDCQSLEAQKTADESPVVTSGRDVVEQGVKRP